MPKLDLGPPPQEVIARIKNVWDRCDKETQTLIDDLFNYWETAETDFCVMNLRLQKQWTEGSNLYTQKEVDALQDQSYNAGYQDAEDAGSLHHDLGFRPQD